ncbi:ABC transporter ATP-binding protein [Actinospica sp.]|uniref:ABC transporter ATP-binding protein n=1 Tax=Actinospica sp. TaxID=1872142 RepID=UPI002C647B10|nr:ABC transporter ATP-binding protein [Actinospica sp.]HWG24631.1 ABC transporter ATP-binding protein [Actinospica sp.]
MTATTETTETAGTPVLEAKNLVKHFPVRRGWALRGAKVHAVEDVSVSLRRGTVTAVVGESGSGKTTLARLLARRTSLTGGELLWEGGDALPAGRAYASEVQLVLQDPFASLNPVHGLRYILGRPLKIHGTADGKSQDDAVKALLERVALTPSDQFIEKMPHELSGGQRQRVAIARALAVRPKVLLADEPVSMLDVSIRLGVLNLLADLRDREQLAILYVTHDLASARYLADTITVMYAGRVVESGPAVTIADSPQHPYTQLLLSAVPDPDRDGAPRLAGAGSPPSLIHPPTGCRFHPRCPFAMAKCKVETPPALSVGDSHTSSCWLHENTENAQASPAAGTAGAA